MWKTSVAGDGFTSSLFGGKAVSQVTAGLVQEYRTRQQTYQAKNSPEKEATGAPKPLSVHPSSGAGGDPTNAENSHPPRVAETLAGLVHALQNGGKTDAAGMI